MFYKFYILISYVILMIKPTTKSIILTTVAMIITILILKIPDITLNGFSQTLEILEFKSNPNETRSVLDFQTPNTDSTVKEKTSTKEEIAMKVHLVPHENKYLNDWHQVSKFDFVTSNTSKLCPSSSDTCEYELEKGEMAEAFDPSERSLIGKFKVDTGISKNLMNLSTIWKAVNELEKDGETIQVIEGTLSLNKGTFQPEHKYQINGTLSKNNDNYFLEIKGKK